MKNYIRIILAKLNVGRCVLIRFSYGIIHKFEQSSGNIIKITVICHFMWEFIASESRFGILIPFDIELTVKIAQIVVSQCKHLIVKVKRIVRRIVCKIMSAIMSCTVDYKRFPVCRIGKSTVSCSHSCCILLKFHP